MAPRMVPHRVLCDLIDSQMQGNSLCITGTDSSIPRTAFANRVPFYQHGLTLIPTWIINYIHYKVMDEIAYPFLNLNGATVEV